MIQKLKHKFGTDFSGFVMGKLRSYRLSGLRMYSSLLARAILRLKGVKLSSKVSFYGLPYVKRNFNSSISIGTGCTFRSDRTSNLIGLNRTCLISTFNEGTTICIGENSGFSGTVIGAAESITIGNNVLSGANVLITDFDWHPIDPTLRHTSEGVLSAPIVIGDNVWLGINTVVLKGVTIGENSVIGANSLVVKDIPANVIAGGNPCKVIKPLT